MVKYHTRFRLLAASLMTVFLLANAPSLQATALQDSGPSFRVKHDKWEDKHDKWEDKKENKSVPEGSAGAILILAAGSLGGAVLIWRRKRRAIVA
jgi:hypothetical protein